MHVPAPKNQTSTPQPSTPQSIKKPAVVIPAPSAEALRPGSITYEENVKLTETSSRKRKRDYYLGNHLHSKDQRAEADEAVSTLQESLESVIEMDGHLSSRQPEIAATMYGNLFVDVEVEDKSFRTLSPEILSKVDVGLAKVLRLRRLDEIGLDQLQKLQGFCSGWVHSAINLELSLEEIEASRASFDEFDLGLQAARVILRTMAGDREDKVLYPEEILESIIRLLQRAINSMTIVIGMRCSGSQEELFKMAAANRKLLTHLLTNTQKVLSLLTRVFAKIEIVDTVISAVESCTIGLLFVENASVEKDSVLGIQKFEGLRRSAMDLITTIYSRYPKERDALFIDILTSLQKLPTGRQAKRHLKLGNGRSIQIFSALIVELVQASAFSFPSHHNPLAKDNKHAETLSEDAIRQLQNGTRVKKQNMQEEDDDSDSSNDAEDSDHDNASQDLKRLADYRCNSAARTAFFAARYLVNRAQTSSKTGDEPHRQLLDIFVEDLLELLNIPEWPAAELILRALLKTFWDIIQDPKSSAPAKNMALELMGNMASTISAMTTQTQRTARSLAVNSELNDTLTQLLNEHIDGCSEVGDVIGWNGPFHAVVDYLNPTTPEDLHKASAQGYFLAQWGKEVANSTIEDGNLEQVAVKLRQMIQKVDYFPYELQDSLSDNQAQVAYTVTILNMDFCRQSKSILQAILGFINTEQPTVRSRALKSFTQIIDNDASLLDRSREARLAIAQCAKDNSPMVRDNALTLISKCISLKPELGLEFTTQVILLVDDSATGVRKRAIKLLKDMYARNSDRETTARISISLLHRVQDSEAGVADLAFQTFEEIWIVPFWSFPEFNDTSAQHKISLKQHFELIAHVAALNQDSQSQLTLFFQKVLSPASKYSNAGSKVCRLLVSAAFEIFLETSEKAIQERTVLALTIFAVAQPSLFTADQIRILQPLINSTQTTEDLPLFGSIAKVFQYVLPSLPATQHELLRTIRYWLNKKLPNLRRSELSEATKCLWSIKSKLEDEDETLITFIGKLTAKLFQDKDKRFDPADKKELTSLKKKLWIVGIVGKIWNFESLRQTFKKLCSWWSDKKDPSVAGLLVATIKPYTGAIVPLTIRATAFESIGDICQTWPLQFTKDHISSAFKDVLQSEEANLKFVILSSFRDFLYKIESQAAVKAGSNKPVPNGADAKIKLGASATASDDDGASTLIAQYFLKDVIKVALAGQDETALAATEVIASINRQGLAHPRSSGSALVALGSSPNKNIAEVALKAHQALHLQHESALEQDYMRAVHEAFQYQRRVVGSGVGTTENPVRAKLEGLWEIIRGSGAKYQKKFLSTFCARIDFDLTKLDLKGSPPTSLQFSRFLSENVALFEFTRWEELLHTVSYMEKIVSNTGSGLAHTISTEIFHLVVDPEPAPKPFNDEEPGLTSDRSPSKGDPAPKSEATPSPSLQQPAAVDAARLYLLTTASLILTTLWEARTYLRRLYGLNSSTAQRSRGRPTTKDSSSNNKPLTRTHGITPSPFLNTIATNITSSLSSKDEMLTQCQRFVDLMRVDDEHRVPQANDGDDENVDFDRLETPTFGADDDGAGGEDVPMSGSSYGHAGARGLKRKGSASGNGTPSAGAKKKRGRPSLKRAKSSGGTRKSWGAGSGGDEDAFGEDDGEWD